MSGRRPRKNSVLIVFLFYGSVVAAQALQLGSRETSEWISTLERPERIAGLKIDEVIARLALKPGMIVADIGAGTGAFSRPFAKAVAPGGAVFAVDIDQGLLDHIAQRARQEKIENLEPVLGKFDDPNLPIHAVDLAFFHDVLHHIEKRDLYLKNLATYLRPAGRIALIEMNEHDPQTPHRNQQELILGRSQVDRWMADLGFHPIKELDLFGDKKWFVIYQRDVPVQPEQDEMEMMHH
ncbi:MAG: class I SAM-dependent methyltransferase [Acidobacteria bacterium]|nr:class I SAM-dependent methyltransferase [Acidobacteriota bacterium]